MKRKQFIRTMAASSAGLLLSNPVLAEIYKRNPTDEFPSNRPVLVERKFVSESVEAVIAEVSKNLKDKELAWMFANCFPNTLDTTVTHTIRNGKPDTFVITGDIDAMWLRDSSAQVWPYVALIKNDKKLKALIEGVIRRQTECILIDPYANAFNNGPGESMWMKDLTTMKPELHERKWEIDSLCYPIRLAHGYWKTSGDGSVFDERWKESIRLVIKTFKEQQRKTSRGPYEFQRVTTRWTDTLTMGGYGMPTKKVGLIHSMFRPSDDACLYPFLIPSNYFASTVLGYVTEIATAELNSKALAAEAQNLKTEVDEALALYATGTFNGQKILAYEVDGFGNQYFADDSNVPSLLSLPYLGALPTGNTLYAATRKFVLSEANPFYFKGSIASGIGGPHVGMDMIWPMAITMQALTSTDNDEVVQCIRQLKATHAGTGFMHEGFHKDDPKNFTRSWFAWANTLFGELIYKQYQQNPELLNKV
jgi:uncharacterized protein